MVKTGKCTECGACRIIKNDVCKKCRILNGKAIVEDEEESE